MKNPMAPYEGQFDNQQRRAFIAESLRECRKAFGRPQKEVAALIGISPQTYNGYEMGRNEPPAEILVRLSYLYNVPINLLVQRDRLALSFYETASLLEANFEKFSDNFKNSLEDNEGLQLQLDMLLEEMKKLTDASKGIGAKLDRKQ